MLNKPFTWQDIEQECHIETDCYYLDRPLGVRISVPTDLHNTFPYNVSAYQLLCALRPQIADFGILHFPDLPLNKTNYTLAQAAPWQHSYSTNPFMTGWCQSPHQDTPPFPTAFGLEKKRRFFATWLLSLQGLIEFQRLELESQASMEQLHRVFVPQSLENGSGILINQKPGLTIIDNSDHNKLYHARTCNFEAITGNVENEQDSFMYAFNEIGLLHYMDTLDSQRGSAWRDEEDKQAVADFIQRHHQ